MHRTAFLFPLLLAASAIAQATPNLAIVCTDATAEGKPVASSCSGVTQTGQVYKTPTATDLVRVDPTRTAGQAGDWSNTTTYAWKRKGALGPGELYEACTTDIPDPTTVGTGCTAWAFIPNSAPSFAVSPLTGRAPLAVTVTWSIPGGTACQAAGGWTGAKAASGTEQVTLQATTALTLACSTPGPAPAGSASLTWTAPTQNTDGTPLTNLAGYQIWKGTSTATLAKEGAQLPKTPLAATVTNLPPGATTYFGISAINSEGATSDIAYGSKAIPNTPSVVPWSSSASVTVTAPPAAKPKAPVLTVQ